MAPSAWLDAPARLGASSGVGAPRGLDPSCTWLRRPSSGVGTSAAAGMGRTGPVFGRWLP